MASNSGLSLPPFQPPRVFGLFFRADASHSQAVEGCGLGFEDVASVRVYLLRFDEDYARMNAVYATYFAEARRPARTCIGVSGLARGARIEIDMLARRPVAHGANTPGIGSGGS